MPSIEMRGCARAARSRAATRLRAMSSLAPLLGLVAFLAYFALAALPQQGLSPPPGGPASGCALLLGYMAWPVGSAVRALGRRNVARR